MEVCFFFLRLMPMLEGDALQGTQRQSWGFRDAGVPPETPILLEEAP